MEEDPDRKRGGEGGAPGRERGRSGGSGEDVAGRERHDGGELEHRDDRAGGGDRRADVKSRQDDGRGPGPGQRRDDRHPRDGSTSEEAGDEQRCRDRGHDERRGARARRDGEQEREGRGPSELDEPQPARPAQHRSGRQRLGEEPKPHAVPRAKREKRVDERADAVPRAGVHGAETRSGTAGREPPGEARQRGRRAERRTAEDEEGEVGATGPVEHEPQLRTNRLPGRDGRCRDRDRDHPGERPSHP